MRALLILSLLVLTACGMHQTGYLPSYTDSGRLRPIVQVIPIFDESGFELPWDMASELTRSLRSSLGRSPQMLLASRVGEHYTPRQREELLGTRLEIFKDLQGVDFAVVIELQEHRIEPYDGQMVRPIYPVEGEAAEIIRLRGFVRVVSLRGPEPEVILQHEVLSNHMVAKNHEFENTDYELYRPSNAAYLGTPIGRAHMRFVRDIATRVERYIVQHMPREDDSWVR